MYYVIQLVKKEFANKVSELFKENDFFGKNFGFSPSDLLWYLYNVNGREKLHLLCNSEQERTLKNFLNDNNILFPEFDWKHVEALNVDGHSIMSLNGENICFCECEELISAIPLSFQNVIVMLNEIHDYILRSKTEDAIVMASNESVARAYIAMKEGQSASRVTFLLDMETVPIESFQS